MGILFWIRIVMFVLLVIGFALVVVSWLFFRRPGVPIWREFPPWWRAGEYLTLPGVVLRFGGYTLIGLGFMGTMASWVLRPVLAGRP
jgi:hypothetical protein